MAKILVSLFSAALFTLGTVAPAVACGSNNKTASEEGKKGDTPKADKTKDSKAPKSPKA